MLGGSVSHGSPEHGVRGVGLQLLRHIEIEQKRLSLGTEQDVLGLDIAVKYALRMGCAQRGQKSTA